MYQKVLVPLKDSEDSRSIVNALSGLVAEDGEAILFHVIPPGKTKGVGEFAILGTQIEEDERARAMVQLNRLSDKLSGHPSSRPVWRWFLIPWLGASSITLQTRASTSLPCTPTDVRAWPSCSKAA